MHAHSARMRFYAELNDFLPEARRQREFTYRFRGSPAIKDAIEALGAPHTEVDLILINGAPVGFEHRLSGGDRVAVYPIFETLDIRSLNRLRPEPLRRTAFVLDVHLGKLARYLRALGFDSSFDRSFDDEDIIALAQREKRIILTRDRGILKNGAVTHGYFVRSIHPREQVVEVLDRFDLRRETRPLCRCLVCNAEILAVEKNAVRDRLPERSRRIHKKFFRCPRCGRLYWKGSHYDRLLDAIRAWTTDA